MFTKFEIERAEKILARNTKRSNILLARADKLKWIKGYIEYVLEVGGSAIEENLSKGKEGVKITRKEINEFRKLMNKDLERAKNLLSIVDKRLMKAHDLEVRVTDQLRRLKTLTAIDSPQDIYDKLSKNVVGQDEAKKALATASFNNLLRMFKDILQPNDPTRLDKDIVLMIGKTGTGKTLLVQELARSLNVPIVIADATKISPTGYTGASVDAWVQELAQKANDMSTGITGEDGKPKQTDTLPEEVFYKGIIFIDEFDKLSSRFDTSSEGSFNTNKQFDMLKLIEGARYKVKVSGDDVEVSTAPIMFILGGAFSGIEQDIQGANGIGFNSSFANKGIKRKITDEDIIKYGFTRELVGRITEIVHLDDMTEELLYKIATHGDNSPVNRYKKMFSLRYVKADISDKLIRDLAHKAIGMGTGARALNKVFKEFFRPYEFEASNYIGKTLHFESTEPEVAKSLKLGH